MPRSLKKSPFVAYHLLKKVNTLTKAGKKDTITTSTTDRKSTRLNSSHRNTSRMPSSA